MVSLFRRFSGARLSQASASGAQAHIAYLDGIRGMAALWVLLAHTQILSGMSPVFLLSYGKLAVDLFILMSGMLMAHHYLLRRAQEPWESPKTWYLFWARRFFRIAPLYYVVLALALTMGPYLGEQRSAIAAYWPYTATSMSRYSNHTLENIAMHVTFLFGLLPGFSFETPLPDWSIGLEMQFYAAFPFLMLLMARLGAVRAAFACVAACLALKAMLPGFFAAFEMPSFLPMKLYMFFCGMMIAAGRWQGNMRKPLLASLILAVPYIGMKPGLESGMQMVLLVVVYYLLNDGSLPSCAALDRVTGRLRGALGGRMARKLGDASYCVYLLHLCVLLPVAGHFAGLGWYMALPGSGRFLCCLLVVAPLVYGLALGMYRFVEQPGIRFGKATVSRFKAAR
jgi:peptidoglycan/LPS O-acetylase OafA/YrhL